MSFHKIIYLIFLIFITFMQSCSIRISDKSQKHGGAFAGALLSDKTGGDTTYTFTFDASDLLYQADSLKIDMPTILYYEWDFNNDGIIDLTTQTPVATHKFSKHGAYYSKVTVVAGVLDEATNTKIKRKSINNFSTETSLPENKLIKFDLKLEEPILVTEKIEAFSIIPGSTQVVVAKKAVVPFILTALDKDGQPVPYGAVSLNTVNSAKVYVVKKGKEIDVTSKTILTDSDGTLEVVAFGKHSILGVDTNGDPVIDLVNDIKITTVSMEPISDVSPINATPDEVTSIKVIDSGLPFITADHGEDYFSSDSEQNFVVQLLDKFGNPVFNSGAVITLTSSKLWKIWTESEGLDTDNIVETTSSSVDSEYPGSISFKVALNGDRSVGSGIVKVTAFNGKQYSFNLSLGHGVATKIEADCAGTNNSDLCSLKGDILKPVEKISSLTARVLDANNNPVKNYQIHIKLINGYDETCVHQAGMAEYGPSLAVKNNGSDYLTYFLTDQNDVFQNEKTSSYYTDSNGLVNFNDFIAGKKAGTDVYAIRFSIVKAPVAPDQYVDFDNINISAETPAVGIQWDMASITATDRHGDAGVQWYRESMAPSSIQVNIVDRFNNKVTDGVYNVSLSAVSLSSNWTQAGGLQIATPLDGSLCINANCATYPDNYTVASVDGTAIFNNLIFTGITPSNFPQSVKLFASANMDSNMSYIFTPMEIRNGVSYSIVSASYGTTVCATSSNCDIDLGSINSDVTTNIVIKNSGVIDAFSAPVITPVSLPANFSYTTNTCTTPLDVNQECTIGIRLSYNGGAASTASMDNASFLITDELNEATAIVNILGHRKTAANLIVQVPVSYNFGEVYYDESKSYSFTLQNTGEVEVTSIGTLFEDSGVSSFTASDTCTSLGYNETCQIDVNFELDLSDIEVGTVSNTLNITSTTESTQTPTTNLSVTGTRLGPPILVFTDAIGVGGFNSAQNHAINVDTNQNQYVTLRITNAGQSPAQFTSSIPIPTGFTVVDSCSSVSNTLNPSTYCDIVLTYSYTTSNDTQVSNAVISGINQTSGNINWNITGHSNSEANLVLQNVSDNLSTGSLINDNYNIGNVNYGNGLRTITVTFRNSGEQASGILSVSSGNTYYTIPEGTNTCTSAVLEPVIGTCSVVVNYNGSVTTPGINQSINLTLSGVPGSSASVNIIATRLQQIALLTISGDTNFGSVDIGNYSERTYTLSSAPNRATATNVSISANNSPHFSIRNNTCGSTRISGTSCTFTVRFVPNDEGNLSTTVTVFYNDGSTNTFISRLASGTGINPVTVLASTYNNSSKWVLPSDTTYATIYMIFTNPSTSSISATNVAFNCNAAGILGEFSDRALISESLNDNMVQYYYNEIQCSTLSPGESCTIIIALKQFYLLSGSAFFTECTPIYNNGNEESNLVNHTLNGTTTQFTNISQFTQVE